MSFMSTIIACLLLVVLSPHTTVYPAGAKYCVLRSRLYNNDDDDNNAQDSSVKHTHLILGKEMSTDRRSRLFEVRSNVRDHLCVEELQCGSPGPVCTSIYVHCTMYSCHPCCYSMSYCTKMDIPRQNEIQRTNNLDPIVITVSHIGATKYKCTVLGTYRCPFMHALCIKYMMHKLSSAGAINYWLCICTVHRCMCFGLAGFFSFAQSTYMVHTDQLRMGKYLVFPPEALMYLHDAELGGEVLVLEGGILDFLEPTRPSLHK